MTEKITIQDVKARFSGHVSMEDRHVTTYYDQKHGISVSVTSKKNARGDFVGRATYEYKYIHNGELRTFKTLQALVDDYNNN